MSLFDIRLNEEGINAIRKFEKLTKWVMGLVIIISTISLLEAWTTYFLAKKEYLSHNKILWFHTQIYPWYMMMYCVLAYTQTHYYVKCGKQLAAAIDTNDEFAFNRSFIFLLRNSFFALLTLSMAVLMVVFRIFILSVGYY
jgi:hypothetical protein